MWPYACCVYPGHHDAVRTGETGGNRKMDDLYRQMKIHIKYGSGKYLFYRIVRLRGGTTADVMHSPEGIRQRPMTSCPSNNNSPAQMIESPTLHF